MLSLLWASEPVPESDSLDGDPVHDFRDGFSNDRSKDGLGRDLFPLTSEEQKKYLFELAGEETVQGRKVYRVRFGSALRVRCRHLAGSGIVVRIKRN